MCRASWLPFAWLWHADNLREERFIWAHDFRELHFTLGTKTRKIFSACSRSLGAGGCSFHSTLGSGIGSRKQGLAWFSKAPPVMSFCLLGLNISKFHSFPAQPHWSRPSVQGLIFAELTHKHNEQCVVGYIDSTFSCSLCFLPFLIIFKYVYT